MFRIFTLLTVTLACCFSSGAAAQPTLSAPVDLSDVATDSRDLQIAMSSDGSKATAVWIELTSNNKRRVKTTSAIIAGGVATWGPVTFLSAADTNSTEVRVQLSSDGSQALAVWMTPGEKVPSAVYSSSASIVGNAASWGAITRLGRTTSTADSGRIALSSDGTRAFAVWQQQETPTSKCFFLFASSGAVRGDTISWGDVQQISEPAGCVQEPALGISSSAGQVTAVWSTRGTGGVATVRTRTGIITGSKTSWGGIADLSAPGFSSKTPTVAMSADGTKATVAWARANLSSGVAVSPTLIRSRSATINGNKADWGATTVLSSTTDTSTRPRLGLSSDGSLATISWMRVSGGTIQLESSSATVVGNVAAWGPVTAFSAFGKTFSANHALSVSGDGSKALSIWGRQVGTKMVMQGALATVGGVAQLWGGIFDISDPIQNSVSPTGVLAADGAVALLGWRQNSGTGKYLARASVAEFVHPTPTPTPVATSTPTTTPTPAPTTTPVGRLSSSAPIPSSASNDHHVVLRVRDYPTNFRRDYYGYLLRATDHKLVKMGKFKVRNNHGRLEFHDVPPGIYRTFTVVIRTKAPKVISSRQRTITVK